MRTFTVCESKDERVVSLVWSQTSESEFIVLTSCGRVLLIDCVSSKKTEFHRNPGLPVATSVSWVANSKNVGIGTYFLTIFLTGFLA